MGVMDILQHYANPGADTQAAPAHFDEVVRNAPADAVGGGVAEAFRSDQTPAFGQMVSRMFGQSNPQQRAGVLNHLLPALGPGALAGLGGGALARLLGQRDNAPAQVTPELAAQVTPDQVEQLATHAQQRDPGVVDKLGGFYSAHPDLVKTLGGAALAVTLASIAGRMRSR
jgi:hypothetical protein